jgi:hypothetical protein
VDGTFDPRQQLAMRLRELREEQWRHVKVTQSQLARALGQGRPISVPLISGWESLTNPKLPPPHRLQAYAAFFATARSMDDAAEPRLLNDDELTEAERQEKAELSRELLHLRAAALPVPGNTQEVEVIESLNSGYWRFEDGAPITIVCAQLPQDKLDLISYSDPADPDYVALYAYADLDAFVELHGHIRAANPGSQVNFRTAPKLVADDYTTHLVSLGGVDWNHATESLFDKLRLPVRQVADWNSSDGQYFEVPGDGEPQRFSPLLRHAGDKKVLREDVALFARAPNPFDQLRSATICNGMYASGTFGVVRALTDARFRDRNANYVKKRFGNSEMFCILTKVTVERGVPVTPDWTVPEKRLFEWTSGD